MGNLTTQRPEVYESLWILYSSEAVARTSTIATETLDLVTTKCFVVVVAAAAVISTLSPKLSLLCIFSFTEEPVFLHANETSEFIKSSNNPAVCGSNRQCTWVIFAHEGLNVQLVRESFEFPSCLGSYLEIRDGPRCSSQLIGTFCGTEKPPPTLCSLGNSLWITFKYNSTRDLQMTRFELLYREVQCTAQAEKQLLFTEPVNSGKNNCKMHVVLWLLHGFLLFELDKWFKAKFKQIHIQPVFNSKF